MVIEPKGKVAAGCDARGVGVVGVHDAVLGNLKYAINSRGDYTFGGWNCRICGS